MNRLLGTLAVAAIAAATPAFAQIKIATVGPMTGRGQCRFKYSASRHSISLE